MNESSSSDLIRFDTANGVFWTRPDDFVTKQLREQGGHQRSELGMLLSFVRPGDMVCDIGAHIGTFSIPLALRVGDEGRVFAFEPVEDSLRILDQNVAANGVSHRLRTLNAIVTDVPGSYSAHMPSDHTSAAHFSLDEPGGVAVPTLRLDEWADEEGLDRLDVIKVDTEGMELRVLRSAESLIDAHRPVIMAEMSGDHLARQGDTIAGVGRFLRRFGYDFFRNLGPRHAVDEAFQLERLFSPVHPSGLFDLVAVHPGSTRYPSNARRPWSPLAGWVARRVRAAPGGIRRRLLG